MEYILIAQSVLILILLVLFLRGEYLIKKKDEKLSQANEESQNESVHMSTNNNKRMHYRLGVEDTPCSISIIGMGEGASKLAKMKEFQGYLDNISATGLRFTATYDLSVKDMLTIAARFRILERDYTIQGKVLRREELLENELYGYGVEFNHSSRAQMASLTNTLLQLEAETLKKGRSSETSISGGSFLPH